MDKKKGFPWIALVVSISIPLVLRFIGLYLTGNPFTGWGYLLRGYVFLLALFWVIYGFISWVIGRGFLGNKTKKQ